MRAYAVALIGQLRADGDHAGEDVTWDWKLDEGCVLHAGTRRCDLLLYVRCLQRWRSCGR